MVEKLALEVIMIALVDIGNSRIKYCFYDQGVREGINYIDVHLFSDHWFKNTFKSITKIIVASVGNEDVTSQLLFESHKNNITYSRIYSEKSKNGVTSAYLKYEQLGVDRWLVLLASAKLYPDKNVLIIDAGTATTIDLLECSGKHVGGWILAGINTLFTSVMKDTSKVQAELQSNASIEFGTDTTQNVNNACWAATVGAIELAIIKAKSINIDIDLIILTGGNAQAIESLLITPCVNVEELIFHGLEAYC